MSDRIHSFTVVLEQTMRDDDAEQIRDAIKMVRGVLTVQENISDGSEFAAKYRLVSELQRHMDGVYDDLLNLNPS